MKFTTVDTYKPGEFAEKNFKQTIDIYEEIIDKKTGESKVVKTGEENFYNKIQEMKEVSTLENIIKRYSIDLNDQHITEISNELIDMTNIPEDLIETYAMINKLENMYNGTSADVKNKFGTFAGFLQAFKDGNVESKLQELASSKTKTKLEAKKIETAEQAEAQRIAELEETKRKYEEILSQGGVSTNE